MESPYQPVSRAPVSAPQGFQWKRTIAWAVMIFAAANVVGLIGGYTMRHWEMYGATFEEAIANARIVRRIGYGVVGAMLYWRFASGVTSRRLLHVLAVFALVQAIDLSFSFLVFSVPAGELFDPWAMGRSLLAATVGAGAAWLGARRSYRPEALRDSA